MLIGIEHLTYRKHPLPLYIRVRMPSIPYNLENPRTLVSLNSWKGAIASEESHMLRSQPLSTEECLQLIAVFPHCLLSSQVNLCKLLEQFLE